MILLALAGSALGQSAPPGPPLPKEGVRPRPAAPAARADEPTQGDPAADPERPLRDPRARALAGSPAAALESWYGRFRESLARELEVQGYEQSTLGQLPLDNVPASQRARRQRVDSDREEFATLEGKVATVPLVLPDPDQAPRALSRRERSLLLALRRAYEGSRDLPKLLAFHKANEDFLRTYDWAQRDQAVRYRFGILEREKAWLELSLGAAEIVEGEEASPQDLDALEATLRKLSPEALEDDQGEKALVLQDEAARAATLAEIAAWVAEPASPHFPSETEAEIIQSLPDLQTALVAACGLTPLVEEQLQFYAEIGTIDAQLEDKGVLAPSPDGRRELKRRKTEIEKQLDRNRKKWMATPPVAEQAATLLDAQDRLLRRRMLDMGPTGALFARRYEVLAEALANLSSHPASTWLLLEDQLALATELEGARPEPGPLDGMGPLPTPIVGASQGHTAALNAKIQALLAAKNQARQKAQQKGGKKPR